MRPIEINNFKLSPITWTAYCDGKVLNSLETARKTQAATDRIFSSADWIYYFCIDFLALFFDRFKEMQFTVIQTLSKAIIEKQESFLKEREMIKEILEKNFIVIEKNVDHLDEAEVICYGENHSEKAHRINNAEMIDALCEEDDFILVEHDETKAFRSRQAKFVKHHLTIQGWDITNDQTLEELSNSSIFALASLLMIPFYPLVGIPAFLYGQYRSAKALQAIYDELPERNQNMCKKIDSTSKPEHRVYVIAGSNHLRPVEVAETKKSRFERIVDWFLPLDRRPQDIAYQETLNSLKKRKFAILTPKHND